MTEWKKVIIPVQHMFPNCNIKYKTKCTDMKKCDIQKEFWEKVKKTKINKKKLKPNEVSFDVSVGHHGRKPPEGFDGW